MSRTARATTSPRVSHSGEFGLASGRHRPAGAEPGFGGGRGTLLKKSTFSRRGVLAGTGRSAEDAGRAHRREEHSVEASVTGGDRLIALIGGEHASILLAADGEY
jgi:hypothetical protein